jgi:hypothetical protein
LYYINHTYEGGGKVKQYEWSNQDWTEADKLFYPKRRVDNKISWIRPHIIGGFKSRRMNRTVEYHSLNECFFYYYLEQNKEIMRYYVQPVEVPIPVIKKTGEKKAWNHVPDVLFFENFSKPILTQIKESPDDVGESFEQCNKRCELMALEKGWKYEVIYPKSLPDIALSNIDYFHGFLRERSYYRQLKNDVLFKVRFDQPISRGQLAKSFCSKYHPNEVKPLISYLIAKGELVVNMFERMTDNSMIRAANETDGHFIGNLLYGKGRLIT